MNAHVGILGHRGYSGAELASILARHPNVTPVLLDHRDDSTPIRTALRHIPYSPDAIRTEQLRVVFLATPPKVSMDLTPALLDAGAIVIDLSGAFRLGTADAYQRWYQAPHTQPALLAEAAYGLPEFCRAMIPGARLIANPGCYPTAANLAIRPLIEAGVIDLNVGIVCDAKSGVSGAGRKPSLTTSFCEVTENFSAYSILQHRHVPEILRISGVCERDLSFTAQLLPIDRGILETIYFRSSKLKSAAELIDIYRTQFASEPFVRIYDEGSVPDLRAVQRTNFCDIGVRFDAATGRAVVVSAIDNLVKGAAGQAVQNMNLALDLPEISGLL